MENNYYKEREFISKPIKLLILGVSILVILLVIAFLLKNNKKEEEFNIEKNFLEIGKEYYQENSGELPSIAGECKQVTLEKLLAHSLIDKTEEYNQCNKYNSYVNVCKLQSGTYQYNPMLVCDDINSEEEYGQWQKGTENDLKPDSSEVRFLFLGYKKVEKEPTEVLMAWKDELTSVNYELVGSTNYYRYRDKEWLWKETKNEYYTNNDTGKSTLAYYAVSPDSKYLNSDSQTTAYKWYTDKTIAIKKYVCTFKNSDSSGIYNHKCEENIDERTETIKEFYTCGVTTYDENGIRTYVEVPEGSLCDCSSEAYGKDCVVEKSYYPSGNNNANKETVYYVNMPIDGAKKDVSTKANVSRYYKEVTTTTSKYYTNQPSSNAIKVGEGRWASWSEYTTSKPKQYTNREIETREKIQYRLKGNEGESWQKIANDYQTLEQFIREVQKLNYTAQSLQDIYDNKNIKYDLQLQYRDKNN